MNRPVFDPLDHLVWGTPDLEATVADLEQRLGVSIPMGGRHPAWGTRNAILSLGDRSYLEIVGADPEGVAPAGGCVFGVDRLTAPRLITWAVGTADVAGRRAAMAAEGFQLGQILPGERVRPDGSRLAWSLTDPFADRMGGVIPFLISWEGSSHPGVAASSCSLVRFRIRHPLGVGLEAALGRAGIHAGVELPTGAGTPGLTATLKGPAGEVTLT